MEGLYLVEGQLAKPSFSSSHISTTDPKKSKSYVYGCPYALTKLSLDIRALVSLIPSKSSTH